MPLGPMLQRVGGLGAQMSQQPTGGLGGFLGNALSGVSRFNERRPELLLAAGQAFKGEDIWPAIAYGQSVRKERTAQAKLDADASKTKRWLMREKGLNAEQADEAMSNKAILEQYLKTAGGDDESFYGTPMFVKRPDGSIAPGQLSNRGAFKPVDLGEGNELAPPTRTFTTKTHQVTVDNWGNVIASEPIQNEQAATDEARGAKIGAGQGEAVESLASLESKMPGLEQTIGQLDQLAEQATYSAAGKGLDWINRQAGFEPRDASVARATYDAMVDNQIIPLLRDTFGAQFTVAEGQWLKNSMSNPDLSPKEKQAVLKAYIEQKRRDVEALRSRTGQPAPAAPPASSGTNRTSSGVEWSID